LKSPYLLLELKLPARGLRTLRSLSLLGAGGGSVLFRLLLKFSFSHGNDEKVSDSVSDMDLS